MTEPRKPSLLQPAHVFGITWGGQLISILGSGLTEFAIGVQVYQLTQSITQFSLVSVFAFLPVVLFSPLAGMLVDRWDRRRAMLVADFGAGLGSLLILLLLLASQAGLCQLHAWYFYLSMLLNASFATLRWPAYYAATAVLVPKQHLGRANALIEVANGSGRIVSPIVAGALMARIGLQGIVLIDLTTFLFAVGSLLAVRFPAPPARTTAATRSLHDEMLQGWRFIADRPGLLGLLVFIIATNFIGSIVTVLITPFVLAFTDVKHLGIILSCAGVGTLLGAVIMSAWGGPRRRIAGVLGFYLLGALVLFAGAFPPSVPLIAAMAFLYLFATPFSVSCFYAIWQSKVPHDLQGRVFSVRRMIALAAPLLGALLCGPLADNIFEPWLAPGGALASTVGRVIGTGPGRGIGFLFILLGVATVAVIALAWLSPRIRHVEDELPDAHAAPPAAPSPEPTNPDVASGAHTP